MIAVQLLLFAVGVAATAPGALSGARWVSRAPRLGIAAWYATVAAWGGAVLTALVLLATGWAGTRDSAGALWAWCRAVLQGSHGPVGHVTSGLVLLLAAGVAGRVAWSAAGQRRASARQRRRHVDTLSLLGRYDPASGVTVVTHPRPAAWLVPGRRHTVVVTSAAVDRLTAYELERVVAHERAHARGRHHLLVAAVASLARAFPAVGLFGHAHTQVSRLVEICADDAATVGHRRIDLARALVRVAESGATSRTAAPDAAAAGTAPGALLAAAGGDAAERVRRLLAPLDPLPLRARITLGGALVILALPPLWVLMVDVAPVLAACR